MAVRSSNMGNITRVRESYKSIVFNRGTLFNLKKREKKFYFQMGDQKMEL